MKKGNIIWAIFITLFLFSKNIYTENVSQGILEGIRDAITDVFGLDPAKDLKRMINRTSSEWEENILNSERMDAIIKEFGPQLGWSIIEKSFLQEKCQQIAERIIKYTPYPELPIRVKLINTKEENAFTTGGKYIYITLPLIGNVETEDALAFVIGHEIGHIIAGHQRRSQKGVNLGNLIVILRKPKTLEEIKSTIRLVTSRYSQEFEKEADVLGAIFGYLAGYNVEDGATYFLELWKKEEIEKEKLLMISPQKYYERRIEEMFFADHPPLPERIKLIKWTKRVLDGKEETHPLSYVFNVLNESQFYKLAKRENSLKIPYKTETSIRKGRFEFGSEPDGFRGIKWGTDINTLQDMKYIKSFPYLKDLQVYVKENELLEIDNATLEKIEYLFLKGRFCGVLIVPKRFVDWYILKNLFFEKYGEGYRLESEKEGVETYEWLGENTWICLRWDKFKEKGKALLWSEKIRQKVKEYIKEKFTQEETNQEETYEITEEGVVIGPKDPLKKIFLEED